MWGQLSRSGILKTKKRKDNVGRGEGQQENKGEAIEELTAKRPADLQQQRCKWWHLATRGLIGPPSWIFLKGLWLFCHFVRRQTALLNCFFFQRLYLMCEVVVKMNAQIPCLGSNQSVQPLHRFTVRYEAVHPVHVQHDLTQSWTERGGGGMQREIGFS